MTNAKLTLRISREDLRGDRMYSSMSN